MSHRLLHRCDIGSRVSSIPGANSRRQLKSNRSHVDISYREVYGNLDSTTPWRKNNEEIERDRKTCRCRQRQG
jgi:hypothetical protein